MLILLALGALLAGGNLWFAAQRSTIPLQLDVRVLRKEVRREKHPGRDDVLLLHLDPPRVLQVDRPVFAAARVGDRYRLQKRAWSRHLEHGDDVTMLSWSKDFQGMTKAMPIVLLVLLATAGYALRANPKTDWR